MNLFDELAKDSEEYLKNYDEGSEGAAGDVMKQIADLEKKMTEKLEEATKNLTKTSDAAEVKNVPNNDNNNESAGTGTATENESGVN